MGDHNDLYEIEVQFEVVTATLENYGIGAGAFSSMRMPVLIARISGRPVRPRKSTKTFASIKETGIWTGANISTKNYMTKDMR